MNSITTRTEDALTSQSLHDWKKAASSWLDNFGSDQTRRAYRQAWAAFTEYTQKTPDQITQDDVIEYRRYLETSTSLRTGKAFTQSTINLHLSALASFFVWAKTRGLRSDNPTAGVARKAVTPYGKATWLHVEDDEDLHFLESINGKTPKGLRDRAIMLLFLTLALRVAEVASLRIGSLRRQGSKIFLTYTRKRGYTREVEIPRETAEAIEAYLKTRVVSSENSPLFTATEAGREAARRLGHDSDEESPLTTRAIAGLVKTYANKSLGKGHKIHPHSLRHTAATAAKDHSSVTDISDFLGHSNTQVTGIYLHATGQANSKVAADLGRRYGKA